MVHTKKTKRSPASILGSAIPNILLMIFSITCIFPAVWLFYSALKTKSQFYQDSIGLPKEITLDNFSYVFSRSNLIRWLGNSFLNSTLALFFILLFSFIIGYFLSRYRFKGRNLLYVYFLFGIIIPIHALMIPVYILFNKLGITNHWFTLILPYTAFGLPLAVFLIESYVSSVPREMEEAAAIDGSSFSRTLFGIILPMCVPILITVGIIQFFWCWNEFSFSLILINDPELVTVPVGMTLFKGQFVTDYPKMIAITLLSLAPVMILYFCFSKQIINGMITGAVKG